MEHRHGFCVDLPIAPVTGVAERDTARRMLRRQAGRGIRPCTLGTDSDYTQPTLSAAYGDTGFGLTSRRSRAGTRWAWRDRRGGTQVCYTFGQRIRKRVELEQIFGWLKMIGGLLKTRFRGVVRMQHATYLVGPACNLLRINRLLAPGPAI